jgi:hypothetical protein
MVQVIIASAQPTYHRREREGNLRRSLGHGLQLQLDPMDHPVGRRFGLGCLDIVHDDTLVARMTSKSPANFHHLSYITCHNAAKVPRPGVRTALRLRLYARTYRASKSF